MCGHIFCYVVTSVTGVRRRCLQLIYNYLMAIPPASVESKRAFAAAGVFCLSDLMINILCFLSSYYLAEQAQC